MKRHGYFRTYLNGEKHDIGSYSLICPGVATVVLGMFYVGMGFIKSGIVTKFSLVHFILLLPFVYVQIKTVFTLLKLDRKDAKTSLSFE